MSVFICSFNANELKELGTVQVQADGTAFRSTHRSGGPASRASAPYTPNECREARVSAPQRHEATPRKLSAEGRESLSEDERFRKKTAKRTSTGLTEEYIPIDPLSIYRGAAMASRASLSFNSTVWGAGAGKRSC